MNQPEPILPGEEAIEAKWKATRGIQRESGEMWLTPRMEREAARLQRVWELQDREEGRQHGD